MRRLEDQTSMQLRNCREDVIQEQDRKFQDLKDRLQREKEEAIDNEREKNQKKLQE
jgi:hypothetical protein